MNFNTDAWLLIVTAFVLAVAIIIAFNRRH
jgi:hypothetical protein